MIKENKTQLFKKHIQMIIQQVTGKKVSQDKAWELFKAIQLGTVEFVNNIEVEKNAKTLSLAGVGKFQVRETAPSGKKAGMVKVECEHGAMVEQRDPDLPVWDVVPRFKFKPSTAIENLLFSMYKCPGYEDVVVKHHGIFTPEIEATVEAEFHENEEVEEVEVVEAEVDNDDDEEEDDDFLF